MYIYIIQNEELKLPDTGVNGVTIESELKNLLTETLMKDPTKRITLEEMMVGDTANNNNII